jgi:DNA-binding NarL/FixJ family response regulator
MPARGPAGGLRRPANWYLNIEVHNFWRDVTLEVRAGGQRVRRAGAKMRTIIDTGTVRVDAGAGAATMERNLRVLVVDGQRSYAELLALALGVEPGLECVGTGSGGDTVALAHRLQPDVLLLDLDAAGDDGTSTVRGVRQVAPDALVAVMSARTDAAVIARASEAGASAFVARNGSLGELLDTLRRVQRGAILISPAVFATYDDEPPPAPAVPALTLRERDVLALLCRGRQVREIAGALHISVHTCRGYVKGLLGKLGVRSQLEAVMRAQALGLAGPAR